MHNRANTRITLRAFLFSIVRDFDCVHVIKIRIGCLNKARSVSGCITVDLLHAVDLGVTAHIIANVFITCLKKQVWGGSTYEENTKGLHEEMVAWHKKNKTKSKLQGKLTYERLRTTSGWPKLKAKAAATRHLIFFALDLATRHCQDDIRIIAVVQLMCEFYTLLESQGQTSLKHRVASCFENSK